MTRRSADYVYRNADDSRRVRVFRRESGRWDYDVFYPLGKTATYSEEAGDDFPTKRAAIAQASEEHGPLFPIATSGQVVDKAWYAKNLTQRLS